MNITGRFVWPEENGNLHKCMTIGCNNDIYAKKLCCRHFFKTNAIRHKKMKCTHEECDAPQKSRGLCSRHYKEFRVKNCCKESGCKNGIAQQDLCSKHYKEGHGVCSHLGCENTKIFCVKRSLCKYHYGQFCSTGECSHPDCSDTKIFCRKRSLCKYHYWRFINGRRKPRPSKKRKVSQEDLPDIFDPFQ